MRHLAPCLILLIAPVVAYASNDTVSNTPRAGCTYTPPESDRSAQSTAPSAVPAATSTNKALPAPRGGDEDLLPRVRSTQWHRYLPGMFR